MSTEKKFKHNRAFMWEADGHRLNLYINAYMNVSVRSDKFKDYIAAGLESIAATLREEAADDRGRYLQSQSRIEEIPADALELKEVAREVKAEEKSA